MNSPHTLAPSPATASPLAILIVDGGARVGFGHVGRCLAIWEELHPHAVFSVEDGDVVGILRSLGAPVGTYDMHAPAALIDRRPPTTATEVARLQARGQRVCLLDDTGTGRRIADLVIDPPTGVDWPPAGGRRLAGFEHVLLRREMRAAAGQEKQGADVLLALGGSDPEGLTPALAAALDAAGLDVLSVLGPGYRGLLPTGHVLRSPRDWPALLARAHLLVARFGHTIMEAAHLGTPALALAMNARAAREAEAFAAHGICCALHVEGPADAARVAAGTLALRGDATRLHEMARRGPELIDGLGAVRVAAALRRLAGAPAPDATGKAA